MTKTTNDPAAAYDDARAKFGELQHEASALERRAQELQGLIRAENPTDRVQTAAEAFLAGESLDNASNYRGELGDTRQRLQVVRRAVELQGRRADQAKRARDEAIMDEHTEGIETAAQKLAEALVVVGDAAEELNTKLGALDDLDVSRLGRFPGLRLDPLRATVEPSRSNSLIDELEQGFGVKVDRKARDAARERRRKLHLREEERKRKAGGAISAGPSGVTHYDRGGRPRQPPETGRRAGADDYLASASWGSR